MFRALADLQNPKEGFDPMNRGEFIEKQTKTFNVQLPNAYPTRGSTTEVSELLKDSGLSLSAWNPSTRQGSMGDINLSDYVTSVDVSKELLDAHQRCKTTLIENLINTENPDKKVRCGWIYTKGQNGTLPQVSEGALGTRAGPVKFVETPKGKWFWSLEDAKKDVLKDRCAALTNCKDVGGEAYAGCAYSTSRGIGVPVDQNGAVLYPKDPRLTAPRNTLVTSPSKCPPPPTPGSQQYEYMRSRDVCYPMPDGRISRDCILQQVTAAGCKMDGALYEALINEAQPTNYGAGLSQLTSFKKYQQLASPNLLDSVIRDGRTTARTALDNFRPLVVESAQVRNTALNFAARDLCLKAGTMGEFDFCSELLDTTTPPFDLDCLQKEFRKQGGQPNGSAYPQPWNISWWNGRANWKEVVDTINDLAIKCKSGDEKVQRTALRYFLGISRERYGPKQISRIQGMEVLWVDRATNTFLGRRIDGAGKARYPEINQVEGNIGGTGRGAHVGYIALFNLRPPEDMSIRLVSSNDDSFVLTKDLGVYNNEHGFNHDDPSIFGGGIGLRVQNNCWNLRKNGPNYISAWWYQYTGPAWSIVRYIPCNENVGNAFWRGGLRPLPPEWLTLTQEMDAPVISIGSGGEHRLNNTIGLAGHNYEFINKPDNTVYYPYPNGIRLHSRDSFFYMHTHFSMNSWRTLTVSFLNSPDNKGRTSGYRLLTFSGLVVNIDDSSIIVTWNSATLSITKRFDNVIDNTNTVMNYIYINMRSDFDGTFPNRLCIAVGNSQQFLNGSIQVNSISQNTATYTTANNSPLDYGLLRMGIDGTNAAAKVILGSVRLFDYELDDNDAIRDVKNNWEMGWVNDMYQSEEVGGVLRGA
jgi:hypothetical protein